MKIHIHQALFSLLAALIVSVSDAAPAFDPAIQPIGYAAPLAVSDAKIGEPTRVFVPKFALDTMSGDLIAVTMSESGGVNLLNPAWKFSEQVNAQHWDTARFIVTMDKDREIVPFRKDDMDGDATKLFKDDEEKRINFLRGDRTEEGNTFRTRDSVLGPLVHSNPVYVGPPKRYYADPDYLQFKEDYATRQGRVYVGSSSGMLHAIDAATGKEVMAYVPRAGYLSMHRYSEDGITLTYGVDGYLTAEDARIGSYWSTVLVGGLGAGGQGFFALDVTSTASVINESTVSGGAGTRILWELNTESDGSENLGYAYSRPSIVKLNSGTWGVVVANGYMSATGRASLYVLDIEDGSIIRELVTSDIDNNGLSSPSIIDSDFDGTADYAYAGDLNGNLWKFDLTSADPTAWSIAYSGTPILQARSSSGERQSIVSAPEIGVSKTGEPMIYVATGRLLADTDDAVTAEQAVYGIRDLPSFNAINLPIDTSELLDQTLFTHYHPMRESPVRTASNNTLDLNSHTGWRLSLDAVDGAFGDRVLQEMTLRNGRLSIAAMNPGDNGQNWQIQVDALSGGGPAQIVYDINRDGQFTVADNIDLDNDGEILDGPEDRVAGVYTGRGVASRATFAAQSNTADTALVNRILSIPPVVTTPEGEPGTDDYGLAGGHMDLDVSSQTYPIDGGATDQHDHEWDNEYGNIVDYFNIDEQGGFRAVDTPSDLPGSSVYSLFIINIANAGLSPGGIIEINGVDFPVTEWQAKVRRYLTGTLNEGELFPIFTLAATSSGENNKGLFTLTSLKTKFFADAILVGGLHPTATGCVKGNDPARNGEYRNGALTTQLLDATGVYNSSHTGAVTPAFDSVRNAYEGSSFAIHGTMNYAVPPVGKTYGSQDGLHWESTLFWHWGGGCYNVDNTADYAQNFQEEIGYEDDRAHDDEPSVGNFFDPYTESTDPVEPGDPEVTQELENEHEVPDELSSRTSTGGRLFWREWVPDND